MFVVRLNMSLKLPTEIPEGDTIVFEDSDVKIIVGNDGEISSGYRLNLFVKNHDKYPDILPNDGMECNHHQGTNKNYSTVSDLPDKYSAKYMKLYNHILSEFDVYRANNTDPIGVCTSCIPQGNSGGLLHFVVFFDEY